MTDKLVEVVDVEKTFRIGFRRKKVRALRGVSFDVKRGEVLGLVGPNGAGKTTSLKILTGLVNPDAGEAKLFGKSADDVESRRRLGYLPESPYFYGHLKGPELLKFYGHLFGIHGKELDRRVDSLIERVGLSHAIDRPIRKFSKGMQQRIGLAQALINDPELVILDEPQSGLDPIGRKDVHDLIVDLNRDGKTILFSSHILPDVEAVCDRVVLIHEGQVRETGTLSELTGDRVESMEVTIRGDFELDGLALDRLIEHEVRADFTILRFGEDADVTANLEKLIAKRASIHSVNPVKVDLEKIFIRDTAPSETEKA